MSEQRSDVDRPTGISLSGRIRRRDSFLDHPLYIAGAVLFGILLGVGVMYGTTIARSGGIAKATPTPAMGIDVTIDGSGTEEEPAPASSPVP